MDKLFHPILYNGCNYLSMLGLKLNHVKKRGPSSVEMDNRRQGNVDTNKLFILFSQVNKNMG